MRKPPFSFRVALLILGGLFTLALGFDLAVRGLRQFPAGPVWEVADGDARRGRAAIERHGCGSCHVIPGIRTATGRVGPQLRGFRDQMYIGGMLPNMPENLVAWIENPKGFNPLTAMPNLNVSPSEARDIAAYLYANP